MSSSNNVTIQLYGKVNTTGVWGSATATFITPDGRQWGASLSLGSDGSIIITVIGMGIDEWMQNYNNSSSGTFKVVVNQVGAGNLQSGTTIELTLTQTQGALGVSYDPSTGQFTVEVTGIPTSGPNNPGGFYLFSENQQLLNEIANALSYLGSEVLIPKGVAPYITGGTVYQDPDTGVYYTFFAIFGVGGSGGSGQVQYQGMVITYNITSTSIEISVGPLNVYGGGTVTGALSLE